MGKGTKSLREGTSFSQEFNNFFSSYNLFGEINVDLRDIRMHSFQVRSEREVCNILGLVNWSPICIVSNLGGREISSHFMGKFHWHKQKTPSVEYAG